jgi:hypothetical protein
MVRPAGGEADGPGGGAPTAAVAAAAVALRPRRNPAQPNATQRKAQQAQQVRRRERELEEKDRLQNRKIMSILVAHVSMSWFIWNSNCRFPRDLCVHDGYPTLSGWGLHPDDPYAGWWSLLGSQQCPLYYGGMPPPTVHNATVQWEYHGPKTQQCVECFMVRPRIIHHQASPSPSSFPSAAFFAAWSALLESLQPRAVAIAECPARLASGWMIFRRVHVQGMPMCPLARAVTHLPGYGAQLTYHYNYTFHCTACSIHTSSTRLILSTQS